MGERHQCQMFAGRTLPGVSESKKRGERKHGRGNSLLCQEGARERESEEEREMGKVSIRMLSYPWLYGQ